MNNTIRSVTTLAHRQFPQLAAALAIAACATTFTSPSFAQPEATVFVLDDLLEMIDGDIARGCRDQTGLAQYAGYYTRQLPSFSITYYTPMSERAWDAREKKWYRLPICKQKRDVRNASRVTYDTTDGTTDPQPGWWVPWGSVPGSVLKRRNVDPNVTLSQKAKEDPNGQSGRN